MNTLPKFIPISLCMGLLATLSACSGLGDRTQPPIKAHALDDPEIFLQQIHSVAVADQPQATQNPIRQATRIVQPPGRTKNIPLPKVADMVAVEVRKSSLK